MSRRRGPRRLLGAAALALLLAPLAARPAAAQQLDLSHGGPIDVTARDGIDWDQNAQTVTARGDARAVRENVTVTADTLIAFYRKKTPVPGAAPAATQASASGPPAGGATPVAAAAAGPPAAGPPGAGPPGAPKPATSGLPGDDTGDNEIYRLEAIGHVLITTPTDQAQGDRAVYDMDRAVLVLTGAHLKLVTPQDVLTARDTMEWWSQKHMAVGRGDAVIVTNDGRRLSADTLVGYTTDPDAPPAAGAQPAKPAPPPKGTPSATQDPLAASGKLQRVDAFGHVEVRTLVDIVRGDRGVYIPDTGIARIVGHVRITRGDNQLNGNEAIVDLHTGISHLVSSPGARVEGLVVPNQAGGGPNATGTPGAGVGAKQPPAAGGTRPTPAGGTRP